MNLKPTSYLILLYFVPDNSESFKFWNLFFLVVHSDQRKLLLAQQKNAFQNETCNDSWIRHIIIFIVEKKWRTNETFLKFVQLTFNEAQK
jgi:hypothetical protein